MRLWFSGIKSDENWTTLNWMNQASVKYWLLDQFDMANLAMDWDELQIPPDVKLACDSGAYRMYKQQRQLSVNDYLDFLERCSLPFEFVVAPDVFGDFEQTQYNWEQVKHYPCPWMPVWGWGADRDRLRQYLDEAPVVGVGGLVPLMRLGSWGNKEEKAQARIMLDELESLCDEFPNRLHIFGINWLKAIETLKGKAASGDTSKFLTGARRAHVIFQHTKTGRLQTAPARAIPQYAHLDRAGRCIESAITLNTYCNKTMSWKNFSIYIDRDKIQIYFPCDPQLDPVGSKVLAMLTSKEFVRSSDRDYIYTRSRTEFWEDQCRKLAAKFNAIVVEQNVDNPAPHPPSTPDPIVALQSQMAAMQAEIAKLKEEVEELKK